MDITKIANKIEELAEEFTHEFRYVEVEATDKTIDIYCDVIGGYEADVNCYYGGEEYVEDFINSIDFIDFDSHYEFDDEDMSCNITIENIQSNGGEA